MTKLTIKGKNLIFKNAQGELQEVFVPKTSFNKADSKAYLLSKDETFKLMGLENTAVEVELSDEEIATLLAK